MDTWVASIFTIVKNAVTNMGVQISVVFKSEICMLLSK